jgi:hemolysin III
MPAEFPVMSAVASRVYDRAERASDRLVHLAGLGFAMAAVPTLVVLAALWRGDAVGLAAVTIYGASFVAMLTASLLYNHTNDPDRVEPLRKWDMAMIYTKIAGTVTPFALLSGKGLGFLAVLWAVALLAATTSFVGPRRSSFQSVGICLVMGWAVLLGGREVLAVLPDHVWWLMIAGGVTYSVGTLFLLAGRMRFHNTIWHVFVVAASIVFFGAILAHLAATSAA